MINSGIEARPSPAVKNLANTHQEVESFAFRNFGHHAALNYCGPLARARFAWAYRAVKDIGSKPAELLDLGCGGGFFSIAAGNITDRVLGVSNDQAALERGQRRAKEARSTNVSFLLADLLQEDFAETLEGRRFDIATCLEVIEHMEEPHRVIESARVAVRPGGHLVLSTPYIGHVPQRNEEELSQRPGGHVVYGYDYDELSDLLEEGGFRVKAFSGVSSIGDHLLNNLSRRLTPTSPLGSLALTSALYPAGKILNTFGERFGFPPVSLGVVAEKHT